MHASIGTSLPGTNSTQSGLTEACLKSPYTKEEVSQSVLDYIKKWIPKQRDGVLAGNSVHADRAFVGVKSSRPSMGS
jgi:oligoribonuclease